MHQIKFVEDSPEKILLGPFLNTLSHMMYDRGNMYWDGRREGQKARQKKVTC